MTHHPFHCDVEPHRETVRVRPVGELDLATVAVVEERLSELRGAGFTDLTLDLREVRFLDSTGLRMIVLWDARARWTASRSGSSRAHPRSSGCTT